MGFRAVLFDWRGTLVTTQSQHEWVVDGLARVDRDEDVNDLVDRIARANGPEDRLDTPGMDADREMHARCFFEVMADASVDSELAAALYASEGDHRRNFWADRRGVGRDVDGG